METSQEDLRRILTSVHTIASVGLSSNPERESYQIDQYLAEHGYRVIAVNPTAGEVFGEKAYASLADLPFVPDAVQIFRKPEDVPPIVDAVIAKGVKILWFQEGTTNAEAAEKARKAGIEVVEDTCMRATHKLLIGGGA